MFDAPWSAKERIKELFDRLKEYFVFAMVTRPPFTEEQLIFNALITIKLTGVFEIATMEWNQFDVQLWHGLKAHFSNAYNTHLDVGAGTAGIAGYHGSANIVDAFSLGLITNSIAMMQLAKNTNVQVPNDNINTITAEMRDLRNTLLATQQ